MRKLGLFLLPLLVLAGCSNASKVGMDASPDEHLKRAQQLIRSGDFETALLHLNQALDRDPHDPDIHNNLGWLYLYTGNYEKAKGELEIVEKARPGSSQVDYLRAGIFSGLNQQQDAVKHYQVALEKEPRNPQIYFDLATSLTALNQYGHAIKTLQSGLALVPKGDRGSQTNFLFSVCSNYYQMKEFEKADKSCQQAITTSPDPEEKERISDFLHQLQLVRQLEEAPTGKGGAPGSR